MDGLKNFFESIFDGTLTGNATFLLIGTIGLVVLVLAFMLDGIFEAFDIGDGPLSVTSISAFAAVFGFVGLVALNSGASVSTASLIGAITGVLGGAGAWGLSRFFTNSESTSSIDSSKLEGETATVTLRINESSMGEIALSKNGHRHTFSAVADHEISLGEKVRIIATLSGSSVKVEKISNTVE